MSTNITSVLTLANIFPQYIASIDPDIKVFDALQTDHWQDEDQTKYLWIVPTDPKAIGYNLDAFRAENKLFEEPEVEDV